MEIMLQLSTLTYTLQVKLISYKKHRDSKKHIIKYFIKTKILIYIINIAFSGIEYPNQLLLDLQVLPWANFLRRFITSQFLGDFKLYKTFKRTEKI